MSNPRTLAGIANWKSSRGEPATEYLNAEEVIELIAAAEAPSPAKPEDPGDALAMQAVTEAIACKDYAKALELVRPLVDQGIPEAQGGWAGCNSGVRGCRRIPSVPKYNWKKGT